jgi:hypothetical protein
VEVGVLLGKALRLVNPPSWLLPLLPGRHRELAALALRLGVAGRLLRLNRATLLLPELALFFAGLGADSTSGLLGVARALHVALAMAHVACMLGAGDWGAFHAKVLGLMVLSCWVCQCMAVVVSLLTDSPVSYLVVVGVIIVTHVQLGGFSPRHKQLGEDDKLKWMQKTLDVSFARHLLALMLWLQPEADDWLAVKVSTGSKACSDRHAQAVGLHGPCQGCRAQREGERGGFCVDDKA